MNDTLHNSELETLVLQFHILHDLDIHFGHFRICLISWFSISLFFNCMYAKIQGFWLVVRFPRTTLIIGHRIKIKLICRLTKDRDQCLISISTFKKFRPMARILLFLHILKLKFKQKEITYLCSYALVICSIKIQFFYRVQILNIEQIFTVRSTKHGKLKLRSRIILTFNTCFNWTFRKKSLSIKVF